MRHVLPAFALLAIIGPAPSGEKKDDKKPRFIGTETMKVGDKGELTIGDGKGPIYTQVFFRVNDVVDKDTAFVRTVAGRPKNFLLKVPTADLVDDALIQPFQMVHVLRTEKHQGRTVFVLQPVK